jgi:hypothetical protein
MPRRRPAQPPIDPEAELRGELGEPRGQAKEVRLVSLYRRGKLSLGGLSEALGLDPSGTEELLRKHNVVLPSPDDAQTARWDRRLLLSLLCAAPMIISACAAIDSILMTTMHWTAEIPAGKIESVLPLGKGDPRFRLDTGVEVRFPRDVIDAGPRPLAVGDRIEKHRSSFTYLLNDTVVADGPWARRTYLLSPWLVVPLTVYLFGSMAYVLKYRRTPVGELAWPQAHPDRPRRPRSVAGLTLVNCLIWCSVVALGAAFFACFQGCMSSILAK